MEDRSPAHHAVDVGDALLLAHGAHGGQVRSRRGIRQCTFDQVHLVRVREPAYRDDSSLWSDDTYPHRIGFDIVDSQAGVRPSQLPSTLVEGIRLSSCNHGEVSCEK